MKLLSIALGLALLGCGDTATGGGDGDGGGTGDGGGDGDGGATSDGGRAVCDKVDILFSIDPSSSMSEELAALRDQVFPAMATELLTVGEGLEDFRTGIIDACPIPADLHTRGDGGECNYEGGERWMVNTSSNFSSEFACAGDLYADNNCDSNEDEDEQPIRAAITALNDPTNSGFARENAVTVIFAMTDEDEENPGNLSARDFYNEIRATKADSQNIVFVGVAGATACSNGAYGNVTEAGTLIRGVTDEFIADGRGTFLDLCEGMLENRLSEVISTIDSACQDIVID